MKNFSKKCIFLLWISLALALVGCSLPISGDLRREANQALNFAQVADNPASYIGKTVIWGGIIEKVQNTSDGAEIQIMQSRLRVDKSPDLKAVGGEFIAITGEIRDLKVLKKGERITVGGDIVGEKIEDTKIEKFRYPVVLIKGFYLWDRGKKWWEPPPSSGWFWELSGASPHQGDRREGVQRYEVW